MVLLLVAVVPTARTCADTGGRVGQVRQAHHLLGHPVISAPPHQALGLIVRNHVDLRQLTGRAHVAGRGRIVRLGVTLTRVCPLLDDRGHPRLGHLRVQRTEGSDFSISDQPSVNAAGARPEGEAPPLNSAHNNRSYWF